MQNIIAKILSYNKKVTLRDIASPKPTRNTKRVLNEILRRANQDQQNIIQKAQNARTNK